MEAISASTDFETPAKMALSIARSASPHSSGKEILQKYRQMMAQKSATILQSPPPSSKVATNDKPRENESATKIMNRNAGVSEEGTGVKNDLSIFQDTSFHSNKGTSRTLHSPDNNSDENGRSSLSLFEGDENVLHSVKSRMKQSLARRRTALRARNMNIPEGGEGGEGNKAKYILNKKKAISFLASSSSSNSLTKMETCKEEPLPEDSKSQTTSGAASVSVVIENIDSAQNDAVDHINQGSPLTMEEVASVGEISLELDSEEDVGTSDVVDSVEEHSTTGIISQTNESHSHSAMSTEGESLELHVNEDQVGSACITIGSYEESLKEQQQQQQQGISCHGEEASSPPLSSKGETSCERDGVETEEEGAKPSHVSDSSGICTEDGELLSVANSCVSVSSASSSQCDDNEGIEGSSSSPVHIGISSSPYTDSVKTFSIGGRSLHMDFSTGRFRSIFSPSASCSADEVSLMDSYGSVSGGTVVPDEAISPTDNYLCTSPANTEIKEDTAESSLDELTRKLDEVRSEKKESSMKMAQSALQAKKLLQMYDKVCTEEKSKTPQKFSTSHSVSPVSKLLAVGIDISCDDGDSFGLSKSAAASLIERNNTLIKEVRFADQTCVELSEKNLAIEREMKAAKETVKELKKEKENLHEAVVRSSQASGRLEESYNEIKLKLGEERERFKIQLANAREDLKEVKEQNKILSQKLENSNREKMQMEKEAVSASSKYDAIREEHIEAKETVSTLMGRLAEAQSASEVSASAAAQEYRDACHEMQSNMDELRELSEERLTALNLERQTRRKVEEELHEIRCMYEELKSARKSSPRHDVYRAELTEDLMPASSKFSSPCSSQTSSKTTASTVLAKTLQEELQRGHNATIRIIEAEKIISVTQSKLRETERKLQATTKENARLRRKFRGALEERSLEGSVCSEDSFDKDDICDIGSNDINEKLASARSQCEEYKMELNAIINQIRGVQSGSYSSAESRQAQDSLKMLEAVQDLAQVCTRVNSVAGNRVSELEGRIQYLAESMNHLNQICAEETSFCSGSSVRGETFSVEESEDYGNSVNTVELPKRDVEDRVTLKLTRLSNELALAKEELCAVSDEKLALTKALSEARRQVEYLTSCASPVPISPTGAHSLQQEKHSLERSVLDLKSQIDVFEKKIEGLEEDKAYLFDDIDGRSIELNEANGKINSLENEICNLNSLLNQVSGEKEVLQDKLDNLESLYVKEKDMWRNRNCKLENEIGDFEERVQFLSDKVELLSQDVIDANSEKERCTQVAAEQANSLKVAYMNCNERLAEVTETNAQLDSTIAKVQKELQVREKELDARALMIEEVSNECIDLKKKLSEADAAVDNTQEELAMMASKVEVLNGINEECKAEWKKEQELRQREVGAINAELNDTKALLDENKMELSSALSSLQATRCELNQFKKEYREQCQVIRAKNDAQSALQRDFDFIESRFNELNANFNRQGEELHSKSSEVSTLQILIDTIRNNYNDLETKSMEQEKCAKTKILMKMEEVASLQETIHELERQVQIKSEAKESAFDELSKLRRKNESLTRKCNRMREYVKNLTQKCKEWESTYCDKDNLSKAYEEKYAEAMAKIQKLTSESSPNYI